MRERSDPCRNCDAASRSAAAEMLRLLAHPLRLKIVARLAQTGECAAGALLEGVDASQSACSQHLAALRTGGLVCCRREGTRRHYSLAFTRETEIRTVLQAILEWAQESGAD
ncbi:MAG: transcriptional regulator [Sphingomonas sp.]|nr:transcriptional regulator [Sphingomonas sp.]|tara:strand:- start:139 stop:474 length:336 start_codon:yes stop_codon:yes gene_type:complete